MELKLVFALIGAVLALIGNIPYLRDTLKGKIHPHPYTWFVWSIDSLVTFFGQMQKGGGYALIATGCAEVFTILIFVASLKNGFTHVRKIDKVFLVAALLGLIPWLVAKDPTISVITVVIIDVIAFIPTLRKAWNYPKSEDGILYAMNVTRHILVMLSLGQYNIATTLHSIAMLITNTTMLGILRTRQMRSRTGVANRPLS